MRIMMWRCGDMAWSRLADLGGEGTTRAMHGPYNTPATQCAVFVGYG